MASPAEQYAAAIKKPARSKYGAKPCEVDGIRFASQREAKRYLFLRTRQALCEIADLELQPKFPLTVNGVNCGFYQADFTYRQMPENRRVVEDSKGVATPVYRLKKKLVAAIHGVDVVEV